MTVSKIWVFAEATEGKVSPTTLEILTKARELADTVEVVTAYGADVADEVGAHGATKVFNVPGTEGKLPARRSPPPSPRPSRPATAPTRCCSPRATPAVTSPAACR
jgi:hypothetical protein